MSTVWSSPTDLREQIIERIGHGENLADVERELIKPAALSEDEKAGLWLFGWSWASSRDRRPKPVSRSRAGMARRPGPHVS